MWLEEQENVLGQIELSGLFISQMNKNLYLSRQFCYFND